MIIGKCLGCGSLYYGWSLINPGIHYCTKCGSRLEIFFDEKGAFDEKRATDDKNLSVFMNYLHDLSRGEQEETDDKDNENE